MTLLDDLKKEKSQNKNSNLLEELKKEKSLSGGEVLKQAVSNIPSSAAQLASDITMPFRHPVQTAQSLASLGKGIYQLATPGEQPDEATAKAVGQFFADRYGSLEGFKNSFAKDPLGIISDISLVLMGGGGIAAKVPGLTGQIAQKVGKVGTAIDPVLATGKAIGATTTGVGKVLAPVLGTTTGAGGDAIKTAYQAGKSGGDAQRVFVDNLRGNVPIEDILPPALLALKKLSSERTGTYKANKATLKLENTPVNFKNIKAKISSFEKSKQYKGVSELSIKGQKKLESIKKIISEWEKNPKLHNAKGMDILKRRIDAEYPTGLSVGDSGIVVSEIRNSVKAQILDEVPEYGKVMKDYETALNLEKQFMSEFSLGKNKNAGTTLKKLQSVMRNNVNTNYGNRLEKLKSLDPDLLPAIAGQALSSPMPRGLQQIGAGGVAAYGAFADPMLLTALPLQSPRLVGEAALKAGQASRKLKPLQNPLLQTARGSRLAGEIVRQDPYQNNKTKELLRLLSQ